jgi:hypothetical protein
MNVRIEIWCEGMDLHGEQLTDIVTVRVPSDIQIVDSKACKEMLERRRRRIREANKYRREFNSRFKDQIELDIFGKKELKEKLYTIKIKNWTPIISRSALEFICDKF